MRPAAEIKDWLDLEMMFLWLQDAPDQQSYQRRLAIWLTHTGKLHAEKVAKTLGVSVQAVWLWIHQYNRLGPEGLERQGRGGRRWGLLTEAQEKRIIEQLRQQQQQWQRGQFVAALKEEIEKQTGQTVSRSYIYRLLKRHQRNNDVLPEKTEHVTKNWQDSFRRQSQPWKRNI